MTIQLTRATFIAGILEAASSQHTLDAATEAYFISIGAATRVGNAPNVSNLREAFTNADGTELVGPSGYDVRTGTGLRTVIFGDSMSDWYSGNYGTNSATYDQSTGVVTLGFANPHRLWNGAIITLFSIHYNSLYADRILPITYIDTTHFSVTLPDKPQDIPNGAMTAPGTHVNNRRYMQSVYHWFQLRNNNRLHIVHNAGHSGERTDQALARVYTDVIAYNPQVVIYQAQGINDQSAAQTLTFEQTKANIQGILDALSKHIPTVIVGTITPVRSGESRGTLGVMRRVIALNKFIRDYARTLKNVHVYDPYSVVVDPTDATGLAKTAMLAGDFIHYFAAGAIAVCKEFERVALPILTAETSSLPKSKIESHYLGALTGTVTINRSGSTVTVTNTNHNVRVGESVRITGATPTDANGVWTVESIVAGTSFSFTSAGTAGAITGAVVSTCKNVLREPLLLTATGGAVAGGVTGTAAYGMKCENTSGTTGTLTAVASVATAAHGFGNEQILTISAAALNDRPSIVTNSGQAYHQYMHQGREYIAECEVRISSANWANTPISEISATFDVAMADGQIVRSYCLDNWDGAANITLAEDMTLHLKWPKIKIPTTSSISYGFLAFYVRAAGTWTSNLTMAMSRIAVVDVTDEGYPNV